MRTGLILAVLALLAVSVSMGSGRQSAVASSPATATWFSWHFDFNYPKVRNFTSWDASTAVSTWASDTAVNPYLTTGSFDVGLYSVYDSMGPAGYVASVYAYDGTACATITLGDTGNCNHSTKLASSASININTYYTPVACQEEWLIAHELGHVWGLMHDNVGLMRSSYVGCYNDWIMGHVSYHINAYY